MSFLPRPEGPAVREGHAAEATQRASAPPVPVSHQASVSPQALQLRAQCPRGRTTHLGLDPAHCEVLGDCRWATRRRSARRRSSRTGRCRRTRQKRMTGCCRFQPHCSFCCAAVRPSTRHFHGRSGLPVLAPVQLSVRLCTRVSGVCRTEGLLGRTQRRHASPIRVIIARRIVGQAVQVGACALRVLARRFVLWRKTEAVPSQIIWLAQRARIHTHDGDKICAKNVERAYPVDCPGLPSSCACALALGSEAKGESNRSVVDERANVFRKKECSFFVWSI